MMTHSTTSLQSLSYLYLGLYYLLSKRKAKVIV